MLLKQSNRRFISKAFLELVRKTTRNESVFVKRLFDLCCATCLLLVSAPLFLIAVVGIKLSSPGPLIYNARRVAKGGGTFEMYKFRSMKVSEVAGPVITAPGDSRVFSFGAFLRATKIDELPQLINVLKGDVSFVGPRPEDPSIVERFYDEDMLKTLEYVPGLTSPGTLHYMKNFAAFVDAGNSEDSYVENILEAKLRIDLEYAMRANLVSDIKLIAATGLFVIVRVVGKLLGKYDHE